MVAWNDRMTWRRQESLHKLADVSSATLRGTIARLTVQGRATGPMAETCRHELTRRGEQA